MTSIFESRWRRVGAGAQHHLAGMLSCSAPSALSWPRSGRIRLACVYLPTNRRCDLRYPRSAGIPRRRLPIVERRVARKETHALHPYRLESRICAQRRARGWSAIAVSVETDSNRNSFVGVGIFFGAVAMLCAQAAWCGIGARVWSVGAGVWGGRGVGEAFQQSGASLGDSLSTGL